MIDQLLSELPLAMDAYEAYKRLHSGRNAVTVLELIEKEFCNELNDVDDAPYIWIGAACAAKLYNELSTAVHDKANESINDLSSNWLSDTQVFEDIKAFLSEPVEFKRLSSESLPAPNPIDWKNGDAFAFPLRSEIARKYHIENRYAVIWKINDEVQTWRKQAHMVYLSVCEQDRLPKTCEDMLNLGFIPHQPRLDGSVYEFEFALYIDNPHTISEMQIFKIGNYPGKPQLKSEIKNSSASHGYPIFADYKKDNVYDLELILCALYKSYGLYT